MYRQGGGGAPVFCLQHHQRGGIFYKCVGKQRLGALHVTAVSAGEMQFSGSAVHRGFNNLLGALLLWMQGGPFSVMSSFTNLRSPNDFFPGDRVTVTHDLPGGAGHIIADNRQLFVGVEVDILL